MKKFETIADLLATLPADKHIKIDYMWVPTRHWEPIEDTNGWRQDGEVEQKFDSDPNVPSRDPEYSYEGRAGDFANEMADYDWLLEESVFEVSDGIYRVDREDY